MYRIRGVRIDDRELPHYTIEYRGEEGIMSELRVFLTQEDGGTLLFPNQMQMMWQSDPDASVPWR